MAGLAYGSELQKRTAVRSFWNGYYSIPNPFEGLFNVRQSDQITDTYARLGAAPFPDEWLGEKKIKDVNEYSKTVTNKPYESAIGIDKAFQVFDMLGEIASVNRNLGEKAAMHRVKLASALIEAGLAGTIDTAEDGQFFFDTDHANSGAEYTTSQDNDLTGAAGDGTVPTDLEFATGVRAIITALYSFKDDRGDPAVPDQELNASNFVIMTAPGFMGTARRVSKVDQLTGPVGNDLKGVFTPRVNPFFASTATTPTMYGFYTGSARKPIIVQEASPLSYKNEIDLSTGALIFSTEWWGRVIYGEWRTAVSYIWT